MPMHITCIYIRFYGVRFYNSGIGFENIIYIRVHAYTYGVERALHVHVCIYETYIMY